MSRSGYIEDCDDIESIARANLWKGAVNSSLKGKRGQAFLKELAAELDKMPDKFLVPHELVTSQGECCTLGVVCKARNVDTSVIDEGDPEEVGKALGISKAMAAKIEYLNDDYMGLYEEPEARWRRMRKWVGEQINGET